VVPIGEKIVGSPTISFTYEGIGKSRAVYVRIVDGSNGKILGRMSTPVPVLTDGMEHTVAVNLHPIVFGASTLGNSPLVVQIRSAAPAFPRETFGEISISNVLVSFPLFAT
jgi:ABC-2 type transport system ATP-binding protein